MTRSRRKTSKPADEESAQYDFFVAHANKDYDKARELHGLLEGLGHRAFLAKGGVPAGRTWPRRIAEAQARSRITVALFSAPYDSDDFAGYLEEEIVRAIKLAKLSKGGHHLVAVYLDGRPELAPYGLEHRNSLDLREEGSLAGVAEKLSASLRAEPEADSRERVTAISTAHALTRQDARVDSFAEQFLGSARLPLPFGGRQAELERLDGWLADPRAAPYLLLFGPAGRGKSALLTRWWKTLEQRERVVFFPVSLTYETSLARVALPAIATRLADALGTSVAIEPNAPPERWHNAIQLLLRRPLGGQRLLIILDGADEASDWMPDFFPELPAEGLRVVLSARPTQQRKDERAWLHALRWRRPGLAESRPLPLLTLEGLEEVLSSLSGLPVPRGDKAALARELFRLTRGDPLLLHLYLEWFQEQHSRGEQLTLEPLRAQASGLEALLDSWKAQQERWLQAQSAVRPPAEALEHVLELLSSTLGPIAPGELEQFAREHAGLEPAVLSSVLGALPRFVGPVGHSGRLAFVHPAVRHAFEARLNRERRVQWARRFADWGQATLAKLVAGQLPPKEVPSYLVRHCTSHLLRVRRGPDELRPILSGAWRAAWDCHEGDSGFLSDVHRVWERASRANRTPLAVLFGLSWLEVELRCALCAASASSLVYSVPPELLWALVESRTWSPQRALHHAQASMNVHAWTAMAVVLLPYLQSETARELLDAVLEGILRDSSMPDVQADTFALLAPHLPMEVAQRSAAPMIEALVRDEALLHVRELLALAPWLSPKLASRLSKSVAGRDAELMEVMSVLARPRASRTEVTRLVKLLRSCVRVGQTQSEALFLYLERTGRRNAPAVASAVLNLLEAGDPDLDAWRGAALAALRPYLDERLLPRAHRIAEGFDNPLSRLIARAALMDPQDEASSGRLVRDGLAASRALPPRERAQALAALVPHARGAEQRTLILECLAVTRRAGLVRQRVLGRLRPFLPAVASEALSLVSRIGDEVEQSKLYVSLALTVKKPRRQQLLQQALARARMAQRVDWKAGALWRVAAALPEEQAKPIRAEALSLLSESSESASPILDELAREVSGKARRELVQFVRKRLAADPDDVGWLFLGQHLPELHEGQRLAGRLDRWGVLDALMEAMGLRNVEARLAPAELKARFKRLREQARAPDEFDRVDILLTLAETKYGKHQRGLLDEAMEAALEKQDDPTVEMEVAKRVSVFSEKELERWLARLETVPWPYPRALMRCRLLDRRHPDAQAIEAILEDMERCGLDFMRVDIIEQLTPYLQAADQPYEHFHQILLILCERPRHFILEALALLRPIWSTLAFDATEAVERVVTDVTRAWP
jgi:hypothetical protein